MGTGRAVTTECMKSNGFFWFEFTPGVKSNALPQALSFELTGREAGLLFEKGVKG